MLPGSCCSFGAAGRASETSVGAFDVDDAGRAARRIALDPGLVPAVEAHGFDRLAVHIGAAARELELHRIVRRDAVELLAREVLLVVGELIGREAAERVDPFAGARARGLGADHLERLAARGDAIEPQFLQPDLALFHQVRVVVDQPGHDGFAGEVDAARVGSGETRDVGGGADGDDAIASDGDGLRDREAVVDGDDLAVGQDDIGRSLLRLADGGRGREHKQRGDTRLPNRMVHGRLHLLEVSREFRARCGAARVCLMPAIRGRPIPTAWGPMPSTHQSAPADQRASDWPQMAFFVFNSSFARIFECARCVLIRIETMGCSTLIATMTSPVAGT